MPVSAASGPARCRDLGCPDTPSRSASALQRRLAQAWKQTGGESEGVDAVVHHRRPPDPLQLRIQETEIELDVVADDDRVR